MIIIKVILAIGVMALTALLVLCAFLYRSSNIWESEDPETDENEGGIKL